MNESQALDITGAAPRPFPEHPGLKRSFHPQDMTLVSSHRWKASTGLSLPCRTMWA